ncbi:hypothetical protein Tco_1521261 [Tanacetum coccineum]
MTLSLPSFRKRYRSSYDTPSSSSPASSPTLPSRKRYRAEDEPLGLGYEAARRRALELAEGTMPSTYEVGQSSRSTLDEQIAYDTPTPRLRSLEQWQEQATITFCALWRPVLALETWAGHSDTQRVTLWQDRYEDQIEIHDLRMQRAADEREL